MSKWSVDDVCDWLSRSGLENYEPNFREHQVDGYALTHLTDDGMTEIGVTVSQCVTRVLWFKPIA